MTPSFWREISALICNFTCESSGNYKDLDKSKRAWNYSVTSLVTIWLHLFQSLEASTPDPTPPISLLNRSNSSTEFPSNFYCFYVRTKFTNRFWQKTSSLVSEYQAYIERDTAIQKLQNLLRNMNVRTIMCPAIISLNFQVFFSCIVFNIGQMNTVP